jgi:AraC-like DNA-binding protein
MLVSAMAHPVHASHRRAPVLVTRHVSALGRWEMATARPVAAILPFARQYVGWDEHFAAPLCRRELPTLEAPLIINFGAPFHLFTPGGSHRHADVTSFITGAYDTFQLVESTGPSSGVQIDLTLLGIRLLVGRPIDDMRNQAVAAEDVFGSFARELVHRLYDAPTWEARFDHLDRALTARLRAAREVPAPVRRAWRRLLMTAGRVSIASIAQESGWSQRHFIAQFRHQLGVSPKVLARMLRFGRVVDAMRAGGGADLAGLATGAGYFDQAHLTRDTREFAGITPGELRASLLPDLGGFVA